MKRIYVFSTLVVSVMMALLAGGCAYHASGWDQQSRKVSLYAPTRIDVPAEYTYAGSMRAMVQGEGDVSLRVPYDTFVTDVFTADNKVMLAQHLIKDDRFYKFRFLGGEKADAWGVTWRTAEYVLDSTAPDSEFAQYLGYLDHANVKLPKVVRVHVLDRLAGDFIVLRVMTLSYGSMAGDVAGLQPMPLFRKMYDQEQANDNDFGNDARILP